MLYHTSPPIPLLFNFTTSSLHYLYCSYLSSFHLDIIPVYPVQVVQFVIIFTYR
jgi:hypothetical protein